MDEKQAKLLYLEAHRALLHAMMALVEVNSRVKMDKLSPKDRRKFMDAMKAGKEASEAMGQTIAAAPDDEELYAQMTASSERMRDEIKHQIEIVEQIIARQSKS